MCVCVGGGGGQARSCIAQSAQENHLDLTNLRYKKKKKKEPEQKKNCSFDARVASATHPLRTYMYVHEVNELCWVGLRAYLFSLWPFN